LIAFNGLACIDKTLYNFAGDSESQVTLDSGRDNARELRVDLIRSANNRYPDRPRSSPWISRFAPTAGNQGCANTADQQ
jgi:hypothetical protein